MCLQPAAHQPSQQADTGSGLPLSLPQSRGATSTRLTPGLLNAGPVSIQKWYQAVVVGLEHVPSTCTVKDPVPSKAGVLSPARTNVTVRKRAPGLAWLDCQLVTGAAPMPGGQVQAAGAWIQPCIPEPAAGTHFRRA